MAEDQIQHDHESPEETEEQVPVCLHCLAEISPQQYYCHKCGESVGQLTGIVAFVNIRFIALFYGRVWRAIWFGADTRIVWRVLLFLMVIALCPLILLGLPFVLWEKFRGKPPEPPAVRDGQARSQRSAE